MSIPKFWYCGNFQKHKEYEKSVRVEEIDGVKLVKNLAVRMEEMFRKKAEATRVGKRFIICTLFGYISTCVSDLRGLGWGIA